jgi:lipoprotein NlpI
MPLTLLVAAVLAAADSDDDPKSAAAYVTRGCARFQSGAVADSIKDFEKAAELEPRLKPELWQLGIAYYYAGRYADGAKLFALHKSVNPDDVENAAWHFLCTAKAEGVEKAKANLMPIRVERDRRVPMAQIYALFQGKARPADVLDNLVRPDERLTEAEQTRRRMYAHLYLGLYFEATGKAKEHLEKAATDAPKVGDYMAGVARVHVERWKKAPGK